MEWLDFGFFDFVWYFVPTNEPTSSPRSLDRWLGVSHCVGSALCYWILTNSGKDISRPAYCMLPVRSNANLISSPRLLCLTHSSTLDLTIPTSLVMISMVSLPIYKIILCQHPTCTEASWGHDRGASPR